MNSDNELKIRNLCSGPCGLGASYQLNTLGHKEWQIFEHNIYVKAAVHQTTDLGNP